MRRSANDWAEDLVNKPVVAGLKILGLLLGVGIVITVILWGFGVVASPWKGAGDAYQQKNSAQNWIAAQKGFNQQDEDIKADTAKIAIAKQDIAAYEQAHPNIGTGTPFDPVAQQDTNLHTTLTGLQQVCLTTVAGYNTDAESYLTQDFKGAGLPDRQDPSACQ